MKIEIELSDELFEDIRNVLSNYADVEVTVDEMKANETFMTWLVSAIPNFFENCGVNADMMEDVGSMGFK